MFPKIFKNVKVLDFSRLLPGPFCSELLIQMGAEATCILPPQGDPLLGAYSPFEKLKRGKNFLTLDLKEEKDYQRAKELLAASEILIEGFRPGTMERLGLGFEEVAKIQPKILYVSIAGYPPGDPKYRKGAHDLNFLIDSGVYNLLFSDNSEEVPPLQLADVVGGFYAAFQILAEWIRRGTNAKAGHLQVSMVEGLRLMSDYLRDPHTPSLLPFLTGELARYRIYRSKDGHRIMVGAIEPKFFHNFLRAIGLEDFGEESEAALIQKIQERLSELSLEEFKERIQDVDACVSIIPSRNEVLSS